MAYPGRCLLEHLLRGISGGHVPDLQSFSCVGEDQSHPDGHGFSPGFHTAGSGLLWTLPPGGRTVTASALSVPSLPATQNALEARYFGTQRRCVGRIAA